MRLANVIPLFTGVLAVFGERWHNRFGRLPFQGSSDPNRPMLIIDSRPLVPFQGSKVPYPPAPELTVPTPDFNPTLTNPPPRPDYPWLPSPSTQAMGSMFPHRESFYNMFNHKFSNPFKPKFKYPQHQPNYQGHKNPYPPELFMPSPPIATLDLPHPYPQPQQNFPLSSPNTQAMGPMFPYSKSFYNMFNPKDSNPFFFYKPYRPGKNSKAKFSAIPRAFQDMLSRVFRTMPKATQRPRLPPPKMERKQTSAQKRLKKRRQSMTTTTTTTTQKPARKRMTTTTTTTQKPARKRMTTASTTTQKPARKRQATTTSKPKFEFHTSTVKLRRRSRRRKATTEMAITTTNKPSKRRNTTTQPSNSTTTAKPIKRRNPAMKKASKRQSSTTTTTKPKNRLTRRQLKPSDALSPVEEVIMRSLGKNGKSIGFKRRGKKNMGLKKRFRKGLKRRLRKGKKGRGLRRRVKRGRGKKRQQKRRHRPQQGRKIKG